MLDTSPENLWKEIRNAEKARDAKLEVFKRQLRAYTSPFFSNAGRSNSATDNEAEPDYDPNNHLFEYIAWMLPQLVYNNPRTSAKSRRVGPPAEIAKSYKYGLDRWVKDEDFAEKLQMPAVDYLMNYGVMLISERDHPSYWTQTNDGDDSDTRARWPIITRIAQDRHIRDPQAQENTAGEFSGHQYMMHKNDLEHLAEDNPDDGWDKDAIEGLTENAGVEEIHSNRVDRYWDIDRKQIVLYELWVKDYIDPEDKDAPGPDEGFNGYIFTLAVNQGDEKGRAGKDGQSLTLIREPRPYFGPPTGPYEIVDCYPVPNEPFRLAPAVAVEGQVRDLNSLSRGINRSAKAYKRLILVNTAHENLVDEIEHGEHDLVIPVPGLDKDQVVINLEVGGVTPEMLGTEERARTILERVSGMTEAARGQVSGDSTATEAALMDANSNVRTDFVKLRFHAWAARILRHIAWRMFWNDDIQFTLSQAWNLAVGVPPDVQAWFVGGDHRAESGMAFEDLELDIEPMSMQRVTEGQQQRNAMQMLGLVAQLAEVIPITPWIEWPRLLDILGEMLNFPMLGDLVNAQMAAEMMGAQVQQQEPLKPRMGGQVGKAGVQQPIRPQQGAAGAGGPGSGLQGRSTGNLAAASQGAA